MDDSAGDVAEAQAPSLSSLKKAASQRSFKESAVSRRTSFDGMPSTIQEEAPPAATYHSEPAPAPPAPAPAPAAAHAAPKPKPPRPSPPKSSGASVGSVGSLRDDMSMDSKANSINTRSSIRDYIRNERDTILRKNMALYETLKSEDLRRDQFQTRQLKNVSRNLPIYVQKLIGNLKRKVHRTMRERGGTPFSIIRGMFLHWDAQKNGSLSYDNFASCLNHLGVLIPAEDLKNIFNYYSRKSTSGDPRMGYDELLSDIQHDEPSMLEFVPAEQEQNDENELRFEEHKDKYGVMPDAVKNFIEAVRHHVLKKMRAEGGTLYYHVSKVFTAYDFDYSSALCPEELLQAAKKKFNMSISLKDCQDIVKFYDRKGAGEMEHGTFINDICSGLTPILHFEEQTATSIENAKQKLNANPFVKKPYKPPSNRVLEKLKDSVHKALDYRLFKVGGSYKSWIHEAFAFWDPKATGKFSNWQTLQGAIRRLGVPISDSECRALMALFDADDKGEFSYNHLLNSLLEGDLGLLADPPRELQSQRQAELQLNHPLLKKKAAMMQEDLEELAKVKRPPKLSATARAPRMVTEYVNKIKSAIDIFVAKSKGSLNPRDILHGTFLRFDPVHSGRVSNDTLSAALKELGVRIKDKDIEPFVAWFDCDGSRTFDYNELTRQIFGHIPTDDLNRSAPLLPVSPMKMTANTGSGSGLLSSLTKPPPAITEKVAMEVNEQSIPSNLRAKETKIVKEARMRAQRERLMEQRKQVAERIESIEVQRKKIVEDYRARHNKDK